MNDYVSTKNPESALPVGTSFPRASTFDFDAAMSNTEDALALIETVQELLDPLTSYTHPGIEEIAELTRRAHMIDATLRAARDKAQDAAALFRKADETTAA